MAHYMFCRPCGRNWQSNVPVCLDCQSKFSIKPEEVLAVLGDRGDFDALDRALLVTQFGHALASLTSNRNVTPGAQQVWRAYWKMYRAAGMPDDLSEQERVLDQEEARALLKGLTASERAVLFADYCQCGSADTGCQCWNDT